MIDSFGSSPRIARGASYHPGPAAGASVHLHQPLVGSGLESKDFSRLRVWPQIVKNPSIQDLTPEEVKRIGGTKGGVGEELFHGVCRVRRHLSGGLLSKSS
jgi:hypothetical protein